MNPNEIPQPAMVGDKPDTETFQGQFDVEKKNGVKLAIRFSFEYPKDEGLMLWKVLSEFQIPSQVIFNHLLETGDASLLARAAAMSNAEGEGDGYLDDHDEED